MPPQPNRSWYWPASRSTNALRVSQPEVEQAHAHGGRACRRVLLGGVGRLRAEEVDLDVPEGVQAVPVGRLQHEAEQRVVRGELRAPVKSGVRPGPREHRVVRRRAVALRAVVHRVELDEAVEVRPPARRHRLGGGPVPGRRRLGPALPPHQLAELLAIDLVGVARLRRRRRRRGGAARARGEMPMSAPAVRRAARRRRGQPPAAPDPEPGPRPGARSARRRRARRAPPACAPSFLAPALVQRRNTGGDHLDDAVDVVDAPAPGAAARLLQRRPQARVVGQLGVRRQARVQPAATPAARAAAAASSSRPPAATRFTRPPACSDR